MATSRPPPGCLGLPKERDGGDFALEKVRKLRMGSLSYWTSVIARFGLYSVGPENRTTGGEVMDQIVAHVWFVDGVKRAV
jgi:hypothetical protein